MEGRREAGSRGRPGLTTSRPEELGLEPAAVHIYCQPPVLQDTCSSRHPARPRTRTHDHLHKLVVSSPHGEAWQRLLG